MKRRNFLRITGPLAFSPVVMKGNLLRPFATGSLTKLFGCEDVNDRHLVVVQIKGGNDGLNCIIPLNQYDLYKTYRPKIAIPQADLVNLDSTVTLERQVGLHPSLTSFKALYERNEFSFVQAVGYANSNKSHFKGTDLWLSGGDSTQSKNNLNSGWLGRYLDSSYPGLAGEPTLDHPDPLGIQLGSKQQSLGFHTEEQHEAGINLSGQDPAGFYTLVSEIGGLPPSNIPASDFGENISYVVDIEDSTNRYAQRISKVFEAGANMGSYPTSDLANQFKTVARLISGGIKTKVFVVTIGGFDTHQNQVDISDPKSGTHGNLMKQLSESILAFQDDLNLLGLSDRVAGVTFSEFGRRPKENGSAGTDHGTVAPMFLFGKAIKSQILGDNVDLSAIPADQNDIVGMQMDYRNVFTALLQDWLGASNSVVTDTIFDDFVTTKADILDTASIVQPGCYIDTYLKTSILSRSVGFNVYPNPALQSIKFQIDQVSASIGYLKIVDMAGRDQIVERLDFRVNPQVFEINVANLMPGNYGISLNLDNSRRQYVSKFLKI